MDTQFFCARCASRTTKQHSIGMLQCRYHPHLEGPIRPMSAPHNVTPKRVNNARGCYACAMTYVGLDHQVENQQGCTAIDHLDASESLLRILTQSPYCVMPTQHFYEAPYIAATQVAHVMRPKSANSGKPTVLHIKSEDQLYEGNKERYLFLKLFGPVPSECALPSALEKAYDAGITLSLISLYNESAELYNYPTYNSSAWIRNVLHANRYVLNHGEKDTGGGVSTMTKEKVCERELYSDEHCVEEHSSFMPFVIILRVEVEQIRISTR